MTPSDFISWRDRCGIQTQAAAAAAIGQSLRQISGYERGERRITDEVAVRCMRVERERLLSDLAEIDALRAGLIDRIAVIDARILHRP